MDNNPFRNHQTTQPNINNSGYTGQTPQPVNNFGYTSPAIGNVYPQQQQQPWQNNTSYSPASAQNTSYQTPTQSSSYSSLQSTTYPSIQTPVQTTPYSSQSTYTPPFQTTSPYNNNSSLMSSNISSPPASGVVGGNTYPPYQAAMPTTPNYQQSPYQQQQQQQQPYQQSPYPQQSTYQQPMFGNQQQQYGMGVNQPNNSFYIPDSFGQSNNNMQLNNNNNNQPKHAPVDATALLKGTQVRRIECPVCQKMIEGDDMAVNHHVNEHYS